MKKNGTLIGLAILLIAIITSCAKMPHEEYDAAEAAFDSLEAHGAEFYMPDEFEEFEELYEDAVALIKDNSYRKGKEGLIAVIEMAEELEEENEELKAEILEELEEIYEEAMDANNDNKNLIPKKGGSSRVMAYKRDVDDIADNLQEVADIMEEDGNLIEATEIATEALEEAEDLSSDIKTAVATSAPPKRPRTTRTQTTSMKMTKKKK